MQNRDIVVIGASAGGVEALLNVVNMLPKGFQAAILVVVHTSPARPNRLPEVINFGSVLPAEQATNGQKILPGHIYVAPSGLHMLVRNGLIELNHGPRENNSRPAIDPLFRSAARYYGHRVIGIILSGSLGDGATGLMIIKNYGGLAIVQAPEEAAFPSMPQTAIAFGQIDYVLPVREIAPLLVNLVNVPLISGGVQSDMSQELNGTRTPDDMAGPVTGQKSNKEFNIDTARAIDEQIEEERPEVINQDMWEQEHNERNGKSAPFSCPNCGGVLWQLDENGILYFQCHVGHRLSPEILLIQKSEELETALWSCIRTLQEKVTLNRQLADRLSHQGNLENAARIEDKVEIDLKTIGVIRKYILDIIPNPVDQSYRTVEDLNIPFSETDVSL